VSENVSDDKLEYTRTLLVAGNVVLLLWTLISTLAVWFYSQVFAWVFLLLAAASIYLLLRRIGCSSCYYCKSCTSGFGRLSGWFFGKRQLKDVNNKTALAFVVFIYFLLGPLSITLLTVTLGQTFDLLRIVLVSGLAAIIVYSALTWLKPNHPKAQVT